jgi:transcription elongation factor GreA
MEYYLTAGRLEELKIELHKLKTEKRREIAERLSRAKELGDLSENAEYLEARENQNQVETRILELEEIIRNAKIIKKSGAKDIVGFGSVVTVSRNNKKFIYTIVGSKEAKPEAGYLSNESPLGRAFFGKKSGESVKVKTPTGEIVYKILKIE